LTFLASFPPPNRSARFLAFSASTGSSMIFFAVEAGAFISAGFFVSPFLALPFFVHTWFPNFFARAAILASFVVAAFVGVPNR
jgi:hypothetical protein